MRTKDNDFSKRQDQLKNRVRKAKEVLTKSKRAMEVTLLHELARNGVYNTNDLHDKYMLKSNVKKNYVRKSSQSNGANKLLNEVNKHKSQR